MAKAKKDFTAVNTGRVYNAIETATAEPAPAPIARRSRSEEPTAQEIKLAREQNKTQGRKGVKAIRINMAFTPEVHDYIRIMARVRGESVTEFTNYVFRQSMEQNADLYDQAKAFRENFNNNL